MVTGSNVISRPDTIPVMAYSATVTTSLP